MGEAAIVPSAGINPNVPVGDEGKVSNRANSMTSFDDVDDAMSSPKAKKAPVKEAPKAKEDKSGTKVRGDNQEEGGFAGGEDEKTKESAKKTEKPDKAEAEKETSKPKTKAKAHKFKTGDQELEVAGDSLVTVTVDGKKREIPLQEILDNHSGETFHREKLTKLDNERRDFVKQRDGLNTMVTDLYARVQKDPDAALDFLADMTKQDPIQLKEGMLRKQIDQFKGLRDMSDEQVETWIKDQVRDWRDKHHLSRAKNEELKQAQQAEESSRSQMSEKYGIDQERYMRAHKLVHDYFKRSDPNFDGKVSPEQIVHADRHMMALEVIHDVVPHLENRSDYDSIVKDIVPDLVRNPSMTREKLGKSLKSVFGEDKEGLKKLGRKADETARSAGTQKTTRNADKEPLNFEDMD